MRAIKRVLDTALCWITVVLFALLVVVLVWQIFTRQVLGDPATWTEEGARLTFVWLGLFTSAFVFGERGHIAVEFLARKLPGGAERVLAIVVQLVVLAFAVVVLIWGGMRASDNAWLQNLSALPFTLGQMYLALPISGVLIAFYSIYYILQVATGAEAPYGDHTDEDDPDVRVGADDVESIVLPDDGSDARRPEADDTAGPNHGPPTRGGASARPTTEA
ncbi:TRAP transporter small permease [Georgenia sp. Z1491]|uniref:TRAP transporter small permease n=1 Tax=Georgenia sp. Z1491 TaxID=3416707 RepID=UPI003CF3A5C9